MYAFWRNGAFCLLPETSVEVEALQVVSRGLKLEKPSLETESGIVMAGFRGAEPEPEKKRGR